MSPEPEENEPNMTTDETARRKQRNIAMALMIIAFVVIVYGVTIMRLGGSIAERSF